ncbi:polysaccharide lyase family 7 protein [Alteromonas sp. 5E99-2]|uniref:polysaccharide lyase family 7 protein n=1 Tax=Alteromonas sp. 5E99-2 TaxID=2817683 RepID=UPI001A98B9B2|nr:polysaccharide lyase family 7 protein [Alteromonas sp. 5E99-2]MBO1255698.1 polysaccharide lyase family 7 protein [Alteromonas sp. 5E99-2]
MKKLVMVSIFMSFAGAASAQVNEFGLDPNLAPWENFDLSVWGLDSPALREISANNETGVRIDDFEFIALREGPNNSDFDDAEDLFFGSDSDVESSDPYFFTGPDGGMVFKSPVNGGRTSLNTRFPRSELREYVRGGVTSRDNGLSIRISGVNENNWVLGYQPDNLILDDNGSSGRGVENVGGRNGLLRATLRVNKVTETGRPDDIGATIIGQIHAEDDEPLRLYYRKLPQNERGSIYALHEINGGSDLEERVFVGSRDDDAENPDEGIALDELFSYEIENVGALINVTVRRGDLNGDIIDIITFDMEAENSDYDRRNEWMYFKAGAYTQNNVAVEEFNNQLLPGADTTGFGPDGTEADFDQITFYQLEVSHDDNDCTACSE